MAKEKRGVWGVGFIGTWDQDQDFFVVCFLNLKRWRWNWSSAENAGEMVETNYMHCEETNLSLVVFSVCLSVCLSHFSPSSFPPHFSSIFYLFETDDENSFVVMIAACDWSIPTAITDKICQPVEINESNIIQNIYIYIYFYMEEEEEEEEKEERREKERRRQGEKIPSRL